MKKIIRKAVALFVSFAIIATNMVSVNNQSLIHAQDELVNVALNEGVQVYTKPNVNNGKNIVDGDTRYQYVTQGARNYIDLSFKDSSLDKTMEQDENGYYYNSDAYIIVDLGKTYSLSSLKVYDFEREGGFERDYIYDIYVSNDPDFDIDFEYNVNWQKVGSKEPNSGKYVTEFALENNIAARYIKLGNLKCKNAEGFVMVELEAYAKETTDLETIKGGAIQQLNDYKADLKLNAEETELREKTIQAYTEKINNASTKEEVYELLGNGQNELATLLEFAEYRALKIDEIKNYKAEDGIFADEEKQLQLQYLESATAEIENAKDVATVDRIVSDYKSKVDELEVLITYEIIPSPHEIIYQNSYKKYQSLIHVVSSDNALDEVTVNYIKEIFGEENVTFSNEKDPNRTNLFLARNDLDDEVKEKIVSTYPTDIDESVLAKNESHIIIADDNGISILGNDDEGLFRGLTTIKFIKEQIEANEKGYRHFVIKDYADMSFRGLIEGYYGKPWSWDEKAELLEFGSDFKMNKIVFAPKNDPYHTTKWKELYPDESVDPENNIQNIEIAAQTARKYKADLVWTAHCFGYTDLANAGENGIRYKEGDENIPGSDINLLKAKFQQMYDAGVRTFGLLLDDCDYGPRTLNNPWPNIYNPNEPLDEAVLKETTAIVNIMADWCKEKGDCYDLIFCPAGYVTSWMQNGFGNYFKQAYPYQEISYYDINFRDNVQIITTGTGVFSDTNQRVADLFKTAGVSSETGYAEGEERRSPLMWTNYPTVDNASALDFGPIENFRTDLNPEDLSGMMSNPFQWAQFNKTVIPMVTQYTWNLKDYDAQEVYNNSMKYIMDTEELANAMLIFTNHNSTRGSEGEGSTELKEAISAFEKEITKENANDVLTEINKIVEACSTLLDESQYTNKGMYDQLYPYANSLRDLAGSIQKYMEAFGEGVNYREKFTDAHHLFDQHTTYVLKDIPQKNGTVKDMYTVCGTRTLQPFYEWLQEHEEDLIYAIDENAQEEIQAKKELVSYLNDQITIVQNDIYYYGYAEKLVEELENKIEEINNMAFENLPSLDELKAEVEAIIAKYDIYKPRVNPNDLISNSKEVILSAGNLENVNGNKVESILDGKINTTCSTVMGEENPAYVQLDFGKEVSLENIHVICYTDPKGKYRWYKYDVYTSTDGEKFELLVNKDGDELEEGNGEWFDARGISARYVRIVGLSNSVNKYFHVAEVEVYKTEIDKTELINLIKKAESYNENLYTLDSWDNLEKALLQAESIVKDSNITQSEVDKSIDELNSAIDGLVYKEADYTKVDEMVTKANALDKNMYKDFSGVEEALANVVYDLDIMHQAEVDTMAKAIEDAISALEYKGADYTALNSAILKATNLDKNLYKDFSAVEKALDAVIPDLDITHQEEVDAMAKAIEDAISALEYKDADYSKVNDAVTKANGLNKDLYKDFSAVEKALEAVNPDLDITQQEEVDAMAKAIEDAIRALEYKDADYSAVEKAKDKVPADLSIYTEESVKALNDALAGVEEGKNITEQKEVDAMAKAIENAINGLVKKDTGNTDKPTDPAIPVEPENPTTPSEPETPTEPKGPNTSDNYHVAVFTGLMILSAGVLALIFIKRKREAK